jgi:soluble lytic murein transglycosylase-like protein
MEKRNLQDVQPVEFVVERDRPMASSLQAAKHLRNAAITLLVCLLFSGAAQAGRADPLPVLLQAIIRIESGGNPYAVFANGKTHYPDSREDALDIIREAHAAGKSYDVGLCQINRYWIDKYAIPVESLLDPDINRQWGAAILADEIARHGLNWKAVGKYHSPDMERGRRYSWRVYQHYKRLFAREQTHGK